METEIAFELPLGYVDSSGAIHRDGSMRLARAGDEILPLEDPRVKGNRAYLVILVLSRVITRLGSLGEGDVTPEIVERFYSVDLAYLEALYARLNGLEAREVSCPHCQRTFPLPSASA
jgi:hypothetical protein